MAKYKVETDKGVYEVETEDTQQHQQQGMERQNVLGQLFNVPGAAIRSAIQGKGYTQGAIQPSSVPKFQQLAIQGSQQSQNPVINAIVGMPASAAGMVADIVTQPADLLAMLIGKAPGAKQLGESIGRLGGEALSTLKKVVKYDNSLKQAAKGKEALDTLRNTLGKAKQIAIQEVADVPTELSFKGNMSDKVIKAIQNPIYEVELNEGGGIKNTVGNLDKIKEAVGELINTEKVWEEAPSKELRIVKQFYGDITKEMRRAAKSVNKPIDDVLDNYHNFMENYRLVNKTLVDTAGQAYGNKIKNAFKFGAEPVYKEAWKTVAKQSPEIKSVMNSMSRRELLKNLLKTTGVVTAAGVGGHEVLKRI